MIEYVLGFLFSPDCKASGPPPLDGYNCRVALILKDHPPWQAGNLNGIGGKKKPRETWQEAMTREFREETGVEIDEWEHTVTVLPPWGQSGPAGPDYWELRVFRAFSDLIWSVRTQESEEVALYPVERLGHLGYLHGLDTIPNLSWIVPLILDSHPITIIERGQDGSF